MALVYTFCFVYSLRLGAIIISIVILINASVFLTLYLLGLEQSSNFSQSLEEFLDNHQFIQSVINFIRLLEELYYYMVGLAVFYSLMIVSCIILLIGAYQCKPKLLYQFLLLYIIYIVLFCLYLLIFYLCLVKEDDALGTIMYFSMAFFVVLFLGYTWVCVYSLIQVIKEVQKKLSKQIRIKVPRRQIKKVNS